jgi:hypothetical protein
MINSIKLSIAKQYYRTFFKNNANSKRADLVYNRIIFLQNTLNQS